MESMATLMQNGMKDWMKRAGKNFDGSMPENVWGFEPRTPEEWLDVYHNKCVYLSAADKHDGISAHLSSNGIVYLSADPEMMQAGQPETMPFPSAFLQRTFDKFSTSVYSIGAQADVKRILNRCVKYVGAIDDLMQNHGGIGLYFSSDTRGSGKTFLSTIVGNELTARGKRVHWFSMPDVLQEIKSTYDRESGTSTSDILRRLQNAQILILDDIGAEKQTPWVNETVYMILNHRMMNNRPTIFTSNLRPDDLKYDDRIKDRIRRMTVELQMPEESVRARLARYSDRDVLRILDA